jgi:hypothetical protein
MFSILEDLADKWRPTEEDSDAAITLCSKQWMDCDDLKI